MSLKTKLDLLPFCGARQSEFWRQRSSPTPASGVGGGSHHSTNHHELFSPAANRTLTFQAQASLIGQGDEITMIGDSREVLVGREQRKSVLTTCRGNQEIDWAGVDSFNATD